jgi:hypothetical protein
MTLLNITRGIYGLFGILYVLIGAGSMLMPAGWLPAGWVPAGVEQEFMTPQMQTESISHLLQEFGTVVIGLGFVFIYFATRAAWSSGFHWAITLYFALDSLIHWIGPHGPIGSWSRGLTNAVPFAVMLLLGLLWTRRRNTR